MTTSVVPDVIAALKTRLAARAGLSGVQVVVGLPYSPGKDFIAILDASPHEQELAAMRTSSAGTRHETFDLEVRISVIRAGDSDHSETVTRAYVLLDEIENELDADATINGTLGTGLARIAALPLMLLGPENGNREAMIRARVECQAIG